MPTARVSSTRPSLRSRVLRSGGTIRRRDPNIPVTCPAPHGPGCCLLAWSTNPASALGVSGAALPTRLLLERESPEHTKAL